MVGHVQASPAGFVGAAPVGFVDAAPGRLCEGFALSAVCRLRPPALWGLRQSAL